MRIAASLLALLVLLSGTAPAVALAGDGAGPAPAATSATTAERPVLVSPPLARIEEPVVTELYIEPDPEGDARWTVSVRYNLSSSADRAAFTEYGRDFEAGDADVGLDAAFFRTLADEAGRETGREMAIRTPTRNATVQNGTGYLNLSFTWTNFVTDTEGGFVIREAVLMPDNRTWLASIGPAQRLVVETPEGYQVTDTRFGLDNGSVVIQGPHTFRDPLTISYQQTAVEQPEPDPGPPWALIVGGLLVALVIVAAVAYVRWRRPPASASTPDAESASSGTADPTAPDQEPTGDDAPADAGGTAAADAGGTAEDDEAADADEAAEIDPSLLSDEERVEHLLDQNGGRMKQARIVQETGWSDAKVSQLLSTMADEGRVEKLRLGRENLISLPDEEP